ncbi:hypothetical protein BKA82DRAFT_4185238 [Pisolithus tinctorius]|nr:hypothetical protein BKA82DRAFT_4185238 [Pisolithus tinctorius]
MHTALKFRMILQHSSSPTFNASKPAHPPTMGMLLSSRQQRTRRRDVNGCTCTFQWHCFASSSKDLETVKCEMKTVDNGIMNHRDIPSCSSVRTATNLYNGNCAKERLGRKTYLQRGRTHASSPALYMDIALHGFIYKAVTKVNQSKANGISRNIKE